MSDRILVPYDGSDHSRRALDRALTTNKSAELIVLHVRDAGAESATEEESEKESDRVVDDARSLAATYGHDIETIQLTGNTGNEIVDFAVANEIDEIVMGSRGRSQPERSTPGSVTNAVIERAPVTVTIVR